MIKADQIKNMLSKAGLKITPQRLIVLESIHTLNNHPTADQIITFIRQTHPNIATGTVYKVLDILEEKELIRKVKTDSDFMRYDAVLEKHHHMYCADSERIEDYFDADLDELLEDYFDKKGIKNFKIEEIKLQLIGKFVNKTNTLNYY
jgi:Fur family transcriptional regulator, peroxide stress response regulator